MLHGRLGAWERGGNGIKLFDAVTRGRGDGRESKDQSPMPKEATQNLKGRTQYSYSYANRGVSPVGFFVGRPLIYVRIR